MFAGTGGKAVGAGAGAGAGVGATAGVVGGGVGSGPPICAPALVGQSAPDTSPPEINAIVAARFHRIEQWYGIVERARRGTVRR